MFNALTVRQSLNFTARLRLPASWSKQRKLARVDDLIDCLNLAKCADTKISDISGGERKRLCIASESIVQPQLMLLDEPTSGLDSTTATHVVRLLRDLTGGDIDRDSRHTDGGGGGAAAAAAADADTHKKAEHKQQQKLGGDVRGEDSADRAAHSAVSASSPNEKKKRKKGFLHRIKSLRINDAVGDVTIACTIHQPSSQIFGLFDDLLFVENGDIVFYGPCKDLVPTLAMVR